MVNSEIKPNKPLSEMTLQELQDFINNVNPDDMGFDGREGIEYE